MDKAPDEPAKAPERSPEFKRLIELRAYLIWVKAGRIKDTDDGSVSKKNWLEAEKQIQIEVEQRAFEIWTKQGKPAKEAGEAVREKNMRAAEAQLLKETEEEFRRHPID